jgi:hypothetical protein
MKDVFVVRALQRNGKWIDIAQYNSRDEAEALLRGSHERRPVDGVPMKIDKGPSLITLSRFDMIQIIQTYRGPPVL